MPTLIRHEGFEIDLLTCMVAEVVGQISDRDVRRAERLVADNIEALQQGWERLHGQE